MDMKKVRDIINGKTIKGFRVHFEKKAGNILTGDWFPDDGDFIESEEGAWILARQFAAKTVGKCINIYVITYPGHLPVIGYQDKEIENR